MYGPDQVDASLCTHIIYAWAHLDPDSGEIVPGNAQLDIENGKIIISRFSLVHSSYIPLISPSFVSSHLGATYAEIVSAIFCPSQTKPRFILQTFTVE